MPFEPKSHSAIIEPFPSLSFFYYTWIKHLERNWVYIDQVSTQYACGNVSWRFDWLLSAKLLHGVYSTEFSMSSLLQCAYSFRHEDPQNEMIIDSHSGCMPIWSLLERHPDFFRVNFMTLNGRRTWIWTWTKAFFVLYLSFTMTFLSSFINLDSPLSLYSIPVVYFTAFYPAALKVCIFYFHS